MTIETFSKNRFFETNITRHRKVLLVLILLVISINFSYACEMIAFKGLNGNNLTKSLTDSGGNDDVRRLFQYFRELGYSANEDVSEERNGLGMVFYLNDSAHTRPGVIVESDGTEDRRFAHYRPNASRNLSIYLPEATGLRIMGHTIPYHTMRTVIGHKRKATSGATSIANPHPFVYRLGDRSYTFAHNGTIRNNHRSQMQTFILNNQHLIQDDQELQLVYNTGSGLDSAIYFTYLLMHIKNQGMDILRGLQIALSSLSFQPIPADNEHNFILTDGYDIYAYKNGPHPLRYYYNDSLRFAFVTTRNRNVNVADIHNPLIPNFAVNLIDRSLLYIPSHGSPIVFRDFTLPNQMVTMYRQYRPGWSWFGFPVIPHPITSMHDYIVSRFGTSSSDGSMPEISAVESQYGVAEYSVGNGWIWGDVFHADAHQNFGMKLRKNRFFTSNPALNLPLPSKHTLHGRLAPLESYPKTFYPFNQSLGNRYWVTYNLTNTQSIKAALGPYFDRIQRVYADTWTFSFHEELWDPKNPGLLDPTPVLWFNSERPMEFGKTYILELKPSAIPITNFMWTDSRVPARKKLPKHATFFEYEQQKEYEAIDIFSLSENQNDVVEIGVFINETCIGAAVVDEFPVQILIYSDGYEGMPITFRALYQNGIVSEINPVVEAYETKTGKKAKKILIAGQIDYVVAKLDNTRAYHNYEIPAMISSRSLYPNPFNPSTTLNFTLTNTSKVTIEVFNIKGQKVSVLFDGLLPSGNHFAKWNGLCEDKRPVSTGVYLYKISTDYHSVTGKMMLIK
jgi:hypothetical protein